jgi:hypothetical protein
MIGVPSAKSGSQFGALRLVYGKVRAIEKLSDHCRADGIPELAEVTFAKPASSVKSRFSTGV